MLLCISLGEIAENLSDPVNGVYFITSMTDFTLVSSNLILTIIAISFLIVWRSVAEELIWHGYLHGYFRRVSFVQLEFNCTKQIRLLKQ